MSSPPSSLGTVKCFPWTRNKTLVIGDAAHGIVPFFGQGMNAGFEDCRVLNDLLNKYHDDWSKVLPEFQHQRKPDTDAIAQLALDNLLRCAIWLPILNLFFVKKLKQDFTSSIQINGF